MFIYVTYILYLSCLFEIGFFCFLGGIPWAFEIRSILEMQWCHGRGSSWGQVGGYSNGSIRLPGLPVSKICSKQTLAFLARKMMISISIIGFWMVLGYFDDPMEVLEFRIGTWEKVTHWAAWMCQIALHQTGKPWAHPNKTTRI